MNEVLTLAKTLLGQEMIWDIANFIQEYITVHNNVSKTNASSFHETMQARRDADAKVHSLNFHLLIFLSRIFLRSSFSLMTTLFKIFS